MPTGIIPTVNLMHWKFNVGSTSTEFILSVRTCDVILSGVEG